MSVLFLRILDMSIKAGWLVMALAAVRPLLKRAPAAIKCAMWAAVALRLMFPFSLKSALSLIPSAVTVSEDILTSPTPSISSGIPAVNSTINPVLGSALAPDPASGTSPVKTLTAVLSLIWAAGVLTMLLYALISYLKLRASVRGGARTQKGVIESAGAPTPFILGMLRPVICLPEGMRADVRENVLAHERAHLARRDHLWKPLGFALLSVYWFNPLMWLAYVLLCRDIELACDERVIKDMGPSERADYSQALLDCSSGRRMVAACPLAFGEVGVKQRVRKVLSAGGYAGWVIALALLTCAVIAVCFLTDPAGRWLAGDDEVLDYVISNYDVDGKKVVSGTFMETGTDERGGYKLFECVLEGGEKAVVRADVEFRKRGTVTGPQCRVVGAQRYDAGSIQGECLTLFDLLSEEEVTLELPQFPGTVFTASAGGVFMTKDGNRELINVHGPVFNAFFCDLNGDGYPELCTTESYGSGWVDERVEVYDLHAGERYELEDRLHFSYSLYTDPHNGSLCVQKMPVMDGDKAVAAGRLALRDGKLLMWLQSEPEVERVKLSELDREQCLQALYDAGVVVPEGIDIDTIDILGMVRSIEERPDQPFVISYSEMLDLAEQVRRAVVRIEGLSRIVACGCHAIQTAWSDGSLIWKDCDNKSKMILGSMHHPAFRLDSRQQLLDFILKYRDDLSLSKPMDGSASFEDIASEYTDAFFSDYCLMAVYISAGSTDFRYSLSSLAIEGNELVASVVRDNYPETYSSAMAGWIFLIEVRRSDTEGISLFDCVQLPGPAGEY